MAVRNLVYSLYERRLAATLVGKPLPRHVGVMVDGNRRWAREMGYVDPNDGHRVGAERIKELLRWCDEAGIGHVTLWLLSTDNLSRPAGELDPLLQIIEDLAVELAAEGNPWRLRMVGALDLLPDAARQRAEGGRGAHRRPHRRRPGQPGRRLRRPAGDRRRGAVAAARARPGRPVRIEELAEMLDVDHIAEHLYTKGQPDPDLVIRTSGEQRLSRLPAVAERALGVLLLRRELARTSGGWTSCARCAATPTASVDSAASSLHGWCACVRPACHRRGGVPSPGSPAGGSHPGPCAGVYPARVAETCSWASSRRVVRSASPSTVPVTTAAMTAAGSPASRAVGTSCSARVRAVAAYWGSPAIRSVRSTRWSASSTSASRSSAGLSGGPATRGW